MWDANRTTDILLLKTLYQTERSGTAFVCSTKRVWGKVASFDLTEHSFATRSGFGRKDFNAAFDLCRQLSLGVCSEQIISSLNKTVTKGSAVEVLKRNLAATRDQPVDRALTYCYVFTDICGSTVKSVSMKMKC